MAGKKTTLIMLGTAGTARVVERSPPVIHYLLVMMLYTSQGQTTRLTFVCKAWWHNRNSLNHSWMHNGKKNCLTIKLMKYKPAPKEVRMLIPNFYT